MKNKILISTLCLLSIFGISNAYEFSKEDSTQITNLKEIIDSASNSGVYDYYNQFGQWYEILEDNDRLGNMSKELKKYSNKIFQSRKTEAKEKSESKKNKLINKYEKNITLDIDFPEDKCMKRYDEIDDLCFANDFPTALAIAVWYRESSCGYSLPDNGDGPFQIVSKDYGTGEMTEELFKETVQDFIDFSKKKIKKYNDRNEGEYPTIDLNYKSYSYEDLWKFAGLYNGLSGGTMIGEIGPANDKYFLEGYEDYKSSKKFGLFAAFLRVLEWELENN